MGSANKKKDGIWNKEAENALSHHKKPLEIAILSEFINGRLFFAQLKNKLRATSLDYQENHFFTTDDDFVYNGFNNDFGPLCLSSLIRYFYLLKRKLLLPELQQKKIIHCTSLLDPAARANASLLMSAFNVVCLGRNPKETLAILSPRYKRNGEKIPSILPFRDASPSPFSKIIQLQDCLNALRFASCAGFFHPDDFDVIEYERFLGTKNGDLNWIVPHRLLAFSGPIPNGVGCKPENYINYFKNNGVVMVVRLNNPLYNKYVFTRAGIQHTDLFFPDGTPPPYNIARAFLDICDAAEAGKWSSGAPGAVAIHCKAGLGRTGALIASRLISRYGMRAKEAIAWIRICRPGSVMSCQQEWLERNEKDFLIEAADKAIKKIATSHDEITLFVEKFKFGIYSIREKILMQKGPMVGEPTPKHLCSIQDEHAKKNKSKRNEEIHIYDQSIGQPEREKKETASMPDISSEKKVTSKRAKSRKRGSSKQQHKSTQTQN